MEGPFRYILPRLMAPYDLVRYLTLTPVAATREVAVAATTVQQLQNVGQAINKVFLRLPATLRQSKARAMDTHLKSISIRHYRSFQGLELKDLKPLNVIGGTNGIGKSALLEAVFNLMDRTNPIALFRPYQWRQVPLTAADNAAAVQQVFYKRDLSKSIEISGQGKNESYFVSYKYGAQAIKSLSASELNQERISSSSAETFSLGSEDGFRIVARRGNKVEFEAGVQLSRGGVLFNAEKVDAQPMPQSIILNLGTRGPESGEAQRYTNLEKTAR